MRLELGGHWPRKHRCLFEGGEAASIDPNSQAHTGNRSGARARKTGNMEDRPPEVERRRSGQVASGH